MNVLEKITQLMNERNWNMYKLSQESGITQSTISNWFNNNIVPSIASLEKICEAFNITLSEFFSEKKNICELSDLQKQVLDTIILLSI